MLDPDNLSRDPAVYKDLEDRVERSVLFPLAMDLPILGAYERMFMAIFRNPEARCGFWNSLLVARISAERLNANDSYTLKEMFSSPSLGCILMRLLSS